MTELATEPSSPADSLPAASTDSLLAQSTVAETLHLRVPSLPELVEKIAMRLKDRALQSGACSEDKECGLVISLTEAITNAIIHGNLEIPSSLKEQPGGIFALTVAQRISDPRYAQRTVDISLLDDGERCTWTITDQGQGFDVQKHLDKLDSEDPQLELASGRGIMLIKAFLDQVAWSNNGRTIQLSLFRHPNAAQRAHSRTPVSHPVRAIPLAADGQVDWHTAFDAVATNLSSEGIGLLAQHPESVHRLLIEIRDGEHTSYLPAEVCHLTQLSESLMQIGCRFQAAPDPQTAALSDARHKALDNLLAQTTSAVANSNERRKDPRMVYTKPIHILLPSSAAADPSTPPHTAIARDLSRTGMAFIADFEIPKNTTLDLLLDPDSPNPIRLSARIVRTHRLAGRFYDFGAQFLD